MEPAAELQRAPKRADGRGKHLWQAFRRRGRIKNIEHPSPYDLGVSALFPWHVVDYPGPRQGSAALLNNRASVATIDNWRAGRRRAPQWAWSLLLTALERRRQELDHAIEMAKKEAGL